MVRLSLRFGRKGRDGDRPGLSSGAMRSEAINTVLALSSSLPVSFSINRDDVSLAYTYLSCCFS
jgi:hypothetical protein